MVHAAIQRGVMPGSSEFERFMENEAFEAGLVDRRQRRAAIRESGKLLERWATHPLRAEIDSVEEVQREIPFMTVNPDGRVESGQIDLLWRGPGGWRLVDFKTDTLRNEAELNAAVEEHRGQVERYIRCAADLLGVRPVGLLCFLDAVGEVHLVEL
jgi:ATP-dependent exoDNAse (exonuclease V) beta subunit